MTRLLVALLAQLLAAPPFPAHADVDAEERRLVGLALDRMMAGQVRVMAVAERMRIDGAELCGRKVAPVLGLYAADRDSFEELYFYLDDFDSFFETAEARFHLGDDPRVLAVVPGLPADTAGIRVGDVIVGVDGREPRMQGDIQLKKKHIRDGVIRFDVLREGRTIRIDVPAKLGCEIPSRFMFGTSINAFARIVERSGESATSDNEEGSMGSAAERECSRGLGVDRPRYS